MTVSAPRDVITAGIRAKIVEIAAGLGIDAADFTDDDIIPATGLLDSAGVLELIVWYETEYHVPLKDDEINIDNLGSINAMTNFLLARRAG